MAHRQKHVSAFAIHDTSPFPDFSSAASAMLGVLHEQLGFDLWMVTRTDGDDWIILKSLDKGYGVHEGQVLRWADSFCSRMVQGLGPRVAPCVAEVTSYLEAPIGRRLQIGAYVGIPLNYADGRLFGTLCAIHPTPVPSEVKSSLPLIEISARLLSTLLNADLRAEEEARRAEHALVDATTDGLTGLHNRRGWDLLLEAEEARCKRYGNPASVIVVDLDGLKLVNDTEGHAAGDQLLRRAATVLKSAARGTDALARVGGDEFALLATETDCEGVEVLVKRILERLDEADVHASVGVATRDPDRGLEHAWELADTTMYAQKRKRKESGVVPVAARRPEPAMV